MSKTYKTGFYVRNEIEKKKQKHNLTLELNSVFFLVGNGSFVSIYFEPPG
jgi:hypothetical protein